MIEHSAMSSGGKRSEKTSNGTVGPRGGARDPPRDETIAQLFGVYLYVSAAVTIAWVFGVYQFSFLWIFILISGLFVLWRSVLTKIITRRLVAEENIIHRKRALKQSETGEWLNFILNRWWVFLIFLYLKLSYVSEWMHIEIFWENDDQLLM